MKKIKLLSSGFLFPTPSFISGAGLNLNIAGSYFSYNKSNSGEEADRLAIENDFRMVGKDIENAIEKITKEK